MQLNWQRNFHRITPDEKERGMKITPYPDEDGVYVISELIEKGQIARYVGKGNIRERISAHKDDTEQNKDLKDLMQNRLYQYRVDFALVSNETDMSNAEFTLFTHYGGIPKLYNDVIPTGVWDDTVTVPF